MTTINIITLSILTATVPFWIYIIYARYKLKNPAGKGLTLKLKDKVTNLVVGHGVGTAAGIGATGEAAAMVGAGRKRKGKHDWVDEGIAPGDLGSVFGDHYLRCSKCGKGITYAAIDHNIFEQFSKNEECPGEGKE